MAIPKQTDPQFKLRLPQELKAAIEDAARENDRSMNAEIVARLSFTLQPGVYEVLTPEKFKAALERDAGTKTIDLVAEMADRLAIISDQLEKQVAMNDGLLSALRLSSVTGYGAIRALEESLSGRPANESPALSRYVLHREKLAAANDLDGAIQRFLRLDKEEFKRVEGLLEVGNVRSALAAVGIDHEEIENVDAVASQMLHAGRSVIRYMDQDEEATGSTQETRNAPPPSPHRS